MRPRRALPPALPDQSERTVIVTGASGGLGLETARALAGAGATVIMAVRGRAKGETAAADISGRTEVRELDLASLSSVRAFAAAWSGPVDVLINNAGIMAVAESRTADGFESQFGVNHLGHFALTALLLPHVTGRVVTVTSDFARRGTLVMDDLNWERRRYRPWPAYHQSKLANLVFGIELQRRLDDRGGGVRSVAADPGVAATGLQRTGGGAYDMVLRLVRLTMQDAAHGALPTLRAATDAGLAGGSLLGPQARARTRERPRLLTPTAAATDPRVGAELWRRSGELTGCA